MGTPFKDYSGMKVGKLTVVARDDSRQDSSKPSRYWFCKCECGKTVSRMVTYLKRRKRSPSCGCEYAYREDDWQHWHWKGCGEVSGEYLSVLAGRGKKFGYGFALTAEYVWKLYLEQEGKCALTGLPITLARNRRIARETPQTASVDRIDSSKGYVEGNVWWVHGSINIMKMDNSVEEFRRLCRLVVEQEDRENLDKEGNA